MQDILCYQCIASDNLSFWTVQLSSIYLMSASQVSAWQWTQLPLIINLLLCISNSWHPLAASSCHGNALPSPGQLPVHICCVFWQLDPSEPPTCVCMCAYVYMSVSKKGVITNYSFSHALVYKPVIIHKSGTCNKAYETVQSKSLKVNIQKHGFIGEWKQSWRDKVHSIKRDQEEKGEKVHSSARDNIHLWWTQRQCCCCTDTEFSQ